MIFTSTGSLDPRSLSEGWIASKDPANSAVSESTLSIERLIKESENNKDRINSIIRFDYIESSKSKNINQNRLDSTLKLLAIDIFKRDHNFEITLLFSNNGFITLTAEILEVVLEDQKIVND